MSEDSGMRARQLMREGNALPHGDVQVSVLQEAVKHADVTRDTRLMFRARMELIGAAVFSGQHDVAIAAFAWSVAHFQQSPEQFRSEESTLLWHFKTILQNAAQFPQISLARFEEIREQMATLYRRAGHNMRPIHYVRMQFGTHIGNRSMAEESYEQFKAERRDGMADCQACEADTTVEYFEYVADPEKTLDAAKLIVAGKRRCAEVPHRTFAYVLRPLAKLGRYDEADNFHTRGYRLVRNNPAFLQHVGLHMVYAVHRDMLPAASRMLQRHLTVALHTRELRSRYYFYVAAGRFLKKLAAQKPNVKLKLPPQFPAYNESGKYDVTELAGWFESERADLGRRFDERNGNQYMTTELIERLQY